MPADGVLEELQAKVTENNRILQALGAKTISFREVTKLPGAAKLAPLA